MKVVWTEQALSRLVEIEDFVAEHSPAAATRLCDALVRKGESLGRFPERGRRLPELPSSELRELIHRAYRIIYRRRNRRIEILTVFEGHRQLSRGELPDD